MAGIIFGPRVLGWFNPLEWVGNSESGLNDLTFQITRVVIGIQVLFTGIALPKAYLKREWVSLTTLLLPIMTAAWFITSLLIWGLIPGLTFLECLVIGACVTPTDPVLANSICKGGPCPRLSHGWTNDQAGLQRSTSRSMCGTSLSPSPVQMMGLAIRSCGSRCT